MTYKSTISARHLIISLRSRASNTLSIHDHAQQCHCDPQADKPTGDKHLRQAALFHPRADGKWYANAKSIAKEGHTCERIACYLITCLA